MHEIARAGRLAALLACLSLVACATGRSASAGKPVAEALASHRAWWQAYATGDQATLAAHSSADVQVVLSAGARMPRAALLDAAGKNKPASGFRMDWSDESVRFPRAGLAIVTATSTERAGSSQQVFRMTSVLDDVGRPDWKILSVQSTRVARFAPAVAPSVHGALGDYAGAYATPKGRLLRMQLRDDALWMVEPDGKAFRLTPTGPGLFEPAGASPLNGVIRFVFGRDESGKVVSFSRLTEGQVDTFPRDN